MLFLEHQILDMQNVVAVRVDISEDKINDELKRAAKQMDDNKMSRNGRAIISMCGDESWLLFPLIDVPAMIPDDWKFKDRFHLESAVRTRHEGEYSRLSKSIDELYGYVIKRGLNAITGHYCVMVRDWSHGVDLKNLIIDIYIGVSNNVL